MDVFGNYSKFDWLGNLRKMNFLLQQYQKFRTPQKTQYGMTNQTKKKNSYYNFKLYKWIRRNKYKWISNGYNYKLDYLLDVFIPQNGTTLYFKSLTNNDAANFQYDLIKAQTTIEGTKLLMLMPLFDEHHICGVVIDYKPAQIVRTNSDENRIPNILLGILTGRESEMLGTLSDDQQQIQIYSDRPYVKLIAADDDCRIYRPFKLKKYTDVKSDDQVFYSWVPNVTTVMNYSVKLVGCFTSSLTNGMPDADWHLGNIKVTLYYRFRNSKF